MGDSRLEWFFLDMTETTAVTKVVEKWQGISYTDYHTWIKTPDGWRITAKLYHVHEEVQR